MTRRTALALTSLLWISCRRQEHDESPEGVVQEWVDRMKRVQGDPEDARRAYEFLSEAAKKNLEERARRASAATGRKMSPESMLAPSRFSLRFSPRKMRARVAGDRAMVEVEGGNADQRAQVPCVREKGRWRVDLVLPPLPAIEKRPDGGGE